MSEWTDIFYLLSVGASSDDRGDIVLQVTMRRSNGEEALKGSISWEAGQMDALAAHVEAIFRSSFQ